MNNFSYAPKLPLEKNNQDSFIFIKDALANVKQKLKMIVLTSKGEKINDPDFGLDLRAYLFEPVSGILNVNYDISSGKKIFSSSNFQEYINSELLKQVDRYSPDISIKECSAEIIGNIVYLNIRFSYRGFMEDNLEISINI